MRPRNKLWKAMLCALLCMITSAGGIGGNVLLVRADTENEIEIINYQSGVADATLVEDSDRTKIKINWEAYTTREKTVDANGNINYGRVELTILAKNVEATKNNIPIEGLFVTSIEYNLEAGTVNANNDGINWSNVTRTIQTYLYTGTKPQHMITVNEPSYDNLRVKPTSSSGGYWPQNGPILGTITIQRYTEYENTDGLTEADLNSWYEQQGGLQELLNEINDGKLTREDLDDWYIHGPEGSQSLYTMLWNINESIQSLTIGSDPHNDVANSNINETTTTTQDAIDDLNEKENAAKEQTGEYILAIDPETMIEESTPVRLINAFKFVRDVHAATIERTAIIRYIGFVMILGLAAYLIGRRGG